MSRELPILEAPKLFGKQDYRDVLKREMEMYKKGETKTKEIQAAYQLLLTYLNTQQKT